jgi:beta-galactosidase
MKFFQAVAVMALLATSLATFAREAQNFDADWRFQKSDAPGGELNEFNDAAWRKLDLPHDWSIEGPFSETNKTGGAGAFLPSGLAWYRKHFSLPENFSNQVVRVEFDGVMQNSDVWINGFHLGHRPFGYASFGYELNGHLNFGKTENVIAVRCDTSEQPASRWYSGAGIYRHVRLVATEPVHIAENGVFVSTPEIKQQEATIHFDVAITNASAFAEEVVVRCAVLAPGQSLDAVETNRFAWWSPMIIKSSPTNLPLGEGASPLVRQGGAMTFSCELPVANPRLWCLENPNVYRLATRVSVLVNPTAGRPMEKIVDEIVTPFGIRTAEFTTNQGFVLNGKKVVLKGVCLHEDGGAFGAAVPLSIWEQRLAELKKLGVNAIRTAHNPPAPEFLDLCDRMGFLVMDEMFDCWTVGKNPFDYHLVFDEWSQRDERDAILRDRNHPSVIIYSVGNEIHDTPQAEKAKKILSGLVAVAHEADPTRPVTQALFRPNVSHDYDDGLADLLDVVGTNYRDNELLAAQRAKPSRKIIGTEQRHDRQTWLWLRDNPSHSGQFLWTGVDYLGESRDWPVVNHSSGLLDRTGEVKPMAFERASWWLTEPMVRLSRRTAPNDRMPTDPGYGGAELHTQVQFADWTSRNPAPHDETVEAYSNCEEVELFLNGKSFGAQKINRDASPRVWKIPFAPGTLKAVARNEKGKVVATDELRTAGKAEKIVLSTETKKLSPGFDNVAVIRARIVDANGITVPRADNVISFNVSGPGVIACVDSGDTVSHEPFQAGERKAFQGECVAFVKATAANGKISVSANASGLKSATVGIKAAAKTE